MIQSIEYFAIIQQYKMYIFLDNKYESDFQPLQQQLPACSIYGRYGISIVSMSELIQWDQESNCIQWKLSSFFMVPCWMNSSPKSQYKVGIISILPSMWEGTYARSYAMRCNFRLRQVSIDIRWKNHKYPGQNLQNSRTTSYTKSTATILPKFSTA